MQQVLSGAAANCAPGSRPAWSTLRCHCSNPPLAVQVVPKPGQVRQSLAAQAGAASATHVLKVPLHVEPTGLQSENGAVSSARAAGKRQSDPLQQATALTKRSCRRASGLRCWGRKCRRWPRSRCRCRTWRRTRRRLQRAEACHARHGMRGVVRQQLDQAGDRRRQPPGMRGPRQPAPTCARPVLLQATGGVRPAHRHALAIGEGLADGAGAGAVGVQDAAASAGSQHRRGAPTAGAAGVGGLQRVGAGCGQAGRWAGTQARVVRLKNAVAGVASLQDHQLPQARIIIQCMRQQLTQGAAAGAASWLRVHLGGLAAGLVSGGPSGRGGVGLAHVVAGAHAAAVVALVALVGVAALARHVSDGLGAAAAEACSRAGAWTSAQCLNRSCMGSMARRCCCQRTYQAPAGTGR